MAWTLTIGGTTIDRHASKVLIDELVPFERDGNGRLNFFKHTSSLAAGADPFVGREVTLSLNGTLVFKGDVLTRRPVKSAERRWFHHYHCEGLRSRVERFPIFDDITGTDISKFNMPGDSPEFVGARAGRNVGQVIAEILGGDTNQARLRAAGVGRFSSVGSGAQATCSISGGVVQTPTVVAGGTGYTTAPTVLFIGGNPTVAATGTATVVSGAVTAISTSGGSGYLSAPTILISTLPASTLADLAALDIVPTFPLTCQGDHFCQAIEGMLKPVYPNHSILILPDGTIRFWDLRKSGGTAVSFTSATGKGALALATISGGVVAGLELIEGGHGYATAPTVAITGTGGSGAAATATVTDGEVTALTLGSGGSGYPEGRTLNLVLDLHRLDPPELTEDTDHNYSRVQINGFPLIDAHELRLGDGSVTEDFGHDGLTVAEAKTHWSYADFEKPGQQGSAALAAANLATAGIASISVVGGGSGYTTAPTVVLTPALGGATATATVSSGAVTGVTVTNAGSGYSSPPSVSFTGGGGSGATATAVLPARAVDSISLIDGGFGYTSAPAVQFLGGGGSGATATATLTGNVVTNIAKTAGGSGYTSPPVVHVGGPASPSADYGSCTVPDTLHVTITPDDHTVSWAAGAWDQQDGHKHGVLILASSTITGALSRTVRKVVANASLSAGGTCSLTLDQALDHTNYDAYALYGTSGGGSVVWRRYKVTDSYVASHMTDQPFTYEFPWIGSDGSSVSLTRYKQGYVQYSSTGYLPFQTSLFGFDLDPVAGTLTVERPVVWYYGDRVSGGADVTGIPNDIRFLVPVFTAANTVASPQDVGGSPQYTGTWHGLYGSALGERTLVVNCPDWRDKSGSVAMQKYADELLDSVKDVTWEGQLSYLGLVAGLLQFGVAVNISGDGFSTGWESVNLPVVAPTLKFHPEGGPLPYSMGISVSNRRAARTSAPYLAPAIGGGQFGGGGGMFFENVTVNNFGNDFGQGVPMGQFESMGDAPGMGGFDPGFGMDMGMPGMSAKQALAAEKADRKAANDAWRSAAGPGTARPQAIERTGPPNLGPDRSSLPPLDPSVARAVAADDAATAGRRATAGSMIDRAGSNDGARQSRATDAIRSQSAIDAGRQTAAGAATQADEFQAGVRQQGREAAAQQAIQRQSEADAATKARQAGEQRNRKQFDGGFGPLADGHMGNGNGPLKPEDLIA